MPTSPAAPATTPAPAEPALEAGGDGRLSAQRDAPVGGQAVLEGVMMRGVSNWAVAVRKPTPEQLLEPHRSPEEAALGEIEVSTFPLDSAMRRHRALRLPIIRGIVALGGSLAIGFRALEVSANAQLPPDERAPGNGRVANAAEAQSGATVIAGAHAADDGAADNGAANDGTVDDGTVDDGAANDGAAIALTSADNAANGATADAHETAPAAQEIPRAVWAGTVIVAVVFAIVLFFLIPVGLTSLIKGQLHSSILFWVIEGLIRTALFLGYMFLLSRIRDLRRVFEYHGAEHKTISCFEAGLPLTPVNAQRFSRLHPRCGTSFLLVVMIVAIFVFAPIGLPAWYWLVLTRILGVPLIAGISFELIKFAGRNRRRPWVRAVMWPGLKLQLLTTREPDLDQLAVAIAALDAVLARETPGALSAEDLVGVEVVA